MPPAKVVNRDGRSKKRLKFASSKERAKHASADVYRKVKRRYDAPSASSREEFVHNPQREARTKKRRRTHHVTIDSNDGEERRSAVVAMDSEEGNGLKNAGLDASTFAEELDLALDRNVSAIFTKFHRQVWGLCRSLAEILHNVEILVQHMMDYMLSYSSNVEAPAKTRHEGDPFVANLATTDILHLVAVLARDIRHEIHPHVHDTIFPRIINDMLFHAASDPQASLDVSVVESAFRTVSYIFRYDADQIVADVDSMRKYYGVLFGHRWELIRRLAAQSFAPLIRRLRSEGMRHRHIRRVLRALAASSSGESLSRRQLDTIDGIGTLLCELCRGATGTLNSKAVAVIAHVLELLASDSQKAENNLILLVVSDAFKKIAKVVRPEFMAEIIDLVLSKAVDATSILDSTSTEMVDLLSETIQLVVDDSSGFAIKQSSARSVLAMSKRILEHKRTDSCDRELKEELLGSLCRIWSCAYNSEDWEDVIRDLVNSALDFFSVSHGADDHSFQSAVDILSYNLVPNLELDIAGKAVCSVLLERLAKLDPSVKFAQMMLTVVSRTFKSDSCHDESLNYMESVSYFRVNPADKRGLIEKLVSVGDMHVSGQASLDITCIAAICIPFLALLPSVEKGSFAKCYSGFISTRLSSGYWDGVEVPSESHQSVLLAKGLLLECVACLYRNLCQTASEKKDVEGLVRYAEKAASKWLVQSGHSLWILRGVAALYLALRECGSKVPSVDLDSTVESFLFTLRNPNHFLRRYSLEILSVFPKRPYVVNHSEIDFSDDLDEEQTRPPSGHASNTTGPSGPCDILDVLLEIEKTTPSLESERRIIALLAKVEVVGRSGRLPVIYAELAAAHIMGIFHVKFSPLWRPAAQALSALIKEHKDVVWKYVEEELVASLGVKKAADASDEDHQSPDVVVCATSQSPLLGIYDETTNGKADTLIWDKLTTSSESSALHLSTDCDTVMEMLWSVAEQCQSVVGTSSRVVVLGFLDFLLNQYFAFHDGEPIKRELHLEDHVSVKSNSEETLGYATIQRRLKATMKALSSIKGPDQLVKSHVIKSIFVAFLSHGDVDVSSCALKGLLHFKEPVLAPHSELLISLLTKKSIREAIMEFSRVGSMEHVNDLDMSRVVPVIGRLLFGRLTWRTKTGKGSKDTPEARRAVAVSFLSSLCRKDHDIFCFLYLMLRPYFPQSIHLRPFESYSEIDVSNLLKSLLGSSVNHIGQLPGQVHEGFLNLLDAVISQCGFRLTPFVEPLTSVLLDIMQVCQIKAPEDDASSSKQPDGDHRRRFHSIRTLCFRLLAALLENFHESIDCNLFSMRFWVSLGGGINMLPEMGANAAKAPALLLLLKAFTVNDRLLAILWKQPEAIDAVVQCISSRSGDSVMEACLTFLEALLLSYQSHAERDSLQLNVGLMIEQFTERLGVNLQNPANGLRFQSAAKSMPSTWRRELEFLCQVSGILVDKKERKHVNNEGLRRLAGLLLSFLDSQGKLSESDQLNVIGVVIGALEVLDVASAASFHDRLSALLGTRRKGEVISPLRSRQRVAEAICQVATRSNQLTAACDVLQRLCAVSTTTVDEHDLDTIISALNELSVHENNGQAEWLSEIQRQPSNIGFMAPLAHCCFSFAYSPEVVLSLTACKALKAIVTLTADGCASKDCEASDAWRKVARTILSPSVRFGLHAKDTQVRRRFILMVRSTSIAFQRVECTDIFKDLFVLVDENNEDMDFFHGVTHVQLHRRAKALQRLRTIMNSFSAQSADPPVISMSTVHNVLLPIVTHHVYESKSNAEESLALEATATIGALSRHLSWSKYSGVLWTAISQLERHPEQEHHIIGMICAIIDAFHFRVESSDESGSDTKSSVWRAVESRFIPKLESLLTKEKVDKHGTRFSSIRPPIVLAMLKLYQRFPAAFFDLHLPRLLTVLVDGLKSRDSSVREISRVSLAKVAINVDLIYLGDILRELAIGLTEGYKLHVRAACIHSILLELSRTGGGSALSCFDESVPALMDMIQEDLFGVAQERKDSQDNHVRYVKEAGGNKSLHSIELVASMISFQPMAPNHRDGQPSSIHAVVAPFLERLKAAEVTAAFTRKIREVLGRVVAGLSRNPNVSLKKLLPFILATLHPFVNSGAFRTVSGGSKSDTITEEEAPRALVVSGSRFTASAKTEKSSMGVVEWRPSVQSSLTSRKTTAEAKRKSRTELHQVFDGANAPKLTGSGRRSAVATPYQDNINNPANVTGVLFALNLLATFQKKHKFTSATLSEELLDAFVPLLVACVCRCRETEVSLLSLKCIVPFLVLDLPSVAESANNLGTHVLELLVSAGASSNKNQDMLQACFKTLTHLVSMDDHNISGEDLDIMNRSKALENMRVLPLTADQMDVLVALLKVSLSESEQHNPAVRLIGALVSRSYASAEFYSLMETIHQLVVRSPKQSLRHHCAGIFVRFLLDYPMDETKFEQYLNQAVSNIKYEYHEGRLSAISELTLLIDRIPSLLLQKHANELFLPLVLQLSNDENEACRKSLSECLLKLLARSQPDVLQDFLQYSTRWLSVPGGVAVSALQTYTLLIEARFEAFSKEDKLFLEQRLDSILSGSHSGDGEWQMVYHALVCLEKLHAKMSIHKFCSPSLWKNVVECLSNGHPWVRLCSARLVHKSTQGTSDQDIADINHRVPGFLFQIVRGSCSQLGLEDDEQNDDLVDLAIKNIVFTIPKMNERPSLFYKENQSDANPLRWLFSRLNQIAKPKGRKRRSSVFKCFGAIVSLYPDLIPEHLELLLEPVYRVVTESTNEFESPAASQKKGHGDDLPLDATLARDVMQLVEEKCADTDSFLSALSSVKSKFVERKQKRKLEEKALAVSNPELAAELKVKKQLREKGRKKRRADEHRSRRGVISKPGR